jgi:hypothetical protein
MNEKLECFNKLIESRWFSQVRDLPVGPDLLKILRSPGVSITEREFKWQLADAILERRYSVEEYERLTDLDFDSREEVAMDLTELWRLVFGAEPIARP